MSALAPTRSLTSAPLTSPAAAVPTNGPGASRSDGGVPALPTRRPPTPGSQRATVLCLGPGDEDPEPVPVATVQGTLALDLRRVPEQPPATALRALPGDASPGQREVHDWAARFAQALVEVIGGLRPLSQLLRWTSARVYADLDRRTKILARTAAPTRPRTVRPQVRSVHVSRPEGRVAEISVHVQHGRRSRALAARLEQRGGRWQCVELELG